MRSLTDTWHGIYGGIDTLRPENSFVATLIETGTVLAGAITERHPGHTHTGLPLNASVLGVHEGSSVSFTKTYQAVAELPDYNFVAYTGIVSADGSEIEGSWDIPGARSGKFLMIRAGRPLLAALRRTAVVTTVEL